MYYTSTSNRVVEAGNPGELNLFFSFFTLWSGRESAWQTAWRYDHDQL